MSAFVVSKAHVDALVNVAAHGPKDAAGQWRGPSWSRPCEPREIIAGEPRYGTTETAWIKLATAGMRELVKSQDEITADELGHMLWAENVASVRYRYPNDAPGEEPGTYCADGSPEWHHGYTFNPRARRLTTVEAFCAISCLDYQSCEHPEWRESEAFRMLQSLKDCLISVLPGYSAGPWEINDEPRVQS